MEVTFLICNYNYGDWIAQSIDSALNQSYPCNICIVDDNSTDKSAEVVDKIFTWETETVNKYYSKKECVVNEKRIVFIQKNINDGPSESRNIGIEETKDFTDVYAILDADDAAKINKVEALIGYFDDPNIGVVYADYYTLNTETKIVAREFKSEYCLKQLYRECIVHSGSLVRKDFLERVKDDFGYYDRNLRVCEDYDLWLRLSRICMIKHHAEPLTIVRITPKNSTNSVDNEVWQSCMYRVRQKCQM